MNLLEIRNLRMHLNTPGGPARAVDGVDLTVRQGEAVGIVGESGSGKSLLAQSILGLLPGGISRILEGSSIRLRGVELVGAEESSLRRVRGSEVAMIFQEPMTSLNPVFRVGSQIRESLKLHRGLAGAEAEKESVRLLREVGIPDPPARIRSFPHQLSGGMRQRVMIAMALAGQPSLVIADEPTTALDVTIEAQILELLASLRRERRMALLLISHDLRVVTRVCQSVYVMYGGQMVEWGPAEEVFRSPRHPYTRGLLGSRLSISDRRKRLRPIPGEVPEARVWPSGCRFHPRCREAVDQCRSTPPIQEETVAKGPLGVAATGPGVQRGARCWFPGEARGRGGE